MKGPIMNQSSRTPHGKTYTPRKRSTMTSISKELNRDLLRDELDSAERVLANALSALKAVHDDARKAGLKGSDHWSLMRNYGGG